MSSILFSLSFSARVARENMHIILMDSDSAVIEAEGSLSSGNERITARLIFDIYIRRSLNEMFPAKMDVSFEIVLSEKLDR